MAYDLSLVIPVLNQKNLTRNCLLSLQGCRLNLEVLIIDNGSHDGTGDMIREEFPHVIYHYSRVNRGVTAAWQEGLQQASSPYVCIANNDVVFEPGCLEGLLRPLQQFDWIGVTSPETATHPEDNRPFPLFSEPTRIQAGSQQTADFRIGYTGWAFTFRKEDFPEGFDPRLVIWYQDHDFLYTLLFKRRGLPPFRWPVPGKVPVIVPGARLYHVYQASHGQVQPGWFKQRIERDRRHFYRKWRGYRGNRYVRDVPWGKAIHAHPPTWQNICGGNGHRPADTGRPLVSVVIPCYERPDLLAETLRSVAQQTHEPIEIILVDDASTLSLRPAAEEALKGFTGAWRMVRLSHNAGPGIARQVGTQLARGAYIQYLDSDDLMQAEKLARQVEFLEAHPEMAMTYAPSAYYQPGAALPPESGLLGRTGADFARILPDVLDRIIWTTSSCLWRREWAGDPTLWKPLYGLEDTVFDFLVGMADRPIGRTPSEGPLLLKRVHGRSLSGGIAGDIPYQQEILKGYDYMWASLQASGEVGRLRRRVAELYAGKIMLFLTHRRYWEAQYCIDRARTIDPASLPCDAKLANVFNRFSGTFLGFGILRRWRWARRIAHRERLAISRVLQRGRV